MDKTELMIMYDEDLPYEFITNSMFDDYMQQRLQEIVELRKQKAKEYTTHSFDENFVKASKLLNIPPEEVALHYMTKQVISFYDIVKSGDNKDKLKEKVNDIVIYLFLIEAIMIGGAR